MQVHINSHHFSLRTYYKGIEKKGGSKRVWGVFPSRSKVVMASSDGNNNTKSSQRVKAIVTLKQNGGGLLNGVVDGIDELVGKKLVLELVSNDLNPKVNSEKGTTIKGYNVHKTNENENNEVLYEASFEVPPEFGEVGAVLVENEQHEELFLKSIVIDGFHNNNGSLNFTCDSWIQPKNNDKASNKRVFFSNKCYLPSETPKGLRKLREEELEELRGNGEGERKSRDRIYDYDVYNDLGDPDLSIQLKRPVLGGSKHYPYPRRCRTGRPHSNKDPLSEKRSGSFYVPRDEEFGERKQKQFTETIVSSGVSAVLKSLDAIFTNLNIGFPSFEDIDSLYKEGYELPPLHATALNIIQNAIPTFFKPANHRDNLLNFDAPQPFKRDKFFWLSDEEFARETLAGVNPYSIQLIKEWPLRSKLDPKVYGPPESAITSEVIESQINGRVEQAISEKKLFMLDYHDLLLPYVSKVREIEGTTLYGSRTIFSLTSKGTLKPLAIELTRPQINNNGQWKRVYTPSSSSSSTELWLWRLAKAHVVAHDCGVHELVSHWLRTHASVEPYVIATNRQLSAMHPINRLLHPHLRYTLEINALARQVLISAAGIIELSFSPQRYSMELSSSAYDQLWRFDLQALPNDLIHRGMAVEDPNAAHGLKLTIEDYPFANDGLLIWDCLKEWITDYVNHYYPNPSTIESDSELQSWWNEIITIGHGDKSSEPWWPNLKTQKDLIHIITTISWVASAHHASVNFAQYMYGGYFPNRPAIARIKMPDEDPSLEEWENFMTNPDQTLLECFPSQIQALLVMVILNLLSDHSPDEEYIGQFMEPSWGEDPIIKLAFERFNKRLKEIEGIIDSRNGNIDLKNRHGAGLVPYELLKPFSGPGLTGKGVPYSISI
ncbi:linoleate 13S-lipoxygenase 2-1, chloroplastic isoform X1 [Arachis hypogaea]|uniref:linoleate 13S-lipoxygenase 2-1, chloroplastic isoform X1 n=1 Tax=Arachis hypogaea TaxID=3818 RepID=UPI000DEC83F8|nr:linoleate 13S-lipoxygenase 2-1, chloroplastic [Arachis hypogaea]